MRLTQINCLLHAGIEATWAPVSNQGQNFA